MFLKTGVQSNLHDHNDSQFIWALMPVHEFLLEQRYFMYLFNFSPAEKVKMGLEGLVFGTVARLL